MTWSIDTDDFLGMCNGPKFPLLRTINHALSMREQGIYSKAGRGSAGWLVSLATIFSSAFTLLSLTLWLLSWQSVIWGLRLCGLWNIPGIFEEWYGWHARTWQYAPLWLDVRNLVRISEHCYNRDACQRIPTIMTHSLKRRKEQYLSLQAFIIANQSWHFCLLFILFVWTFI